MKKILPLLFTLLTIKGNCQIIKFHSGAGYAVVSSNYFKKNTLATNVAVGCEFILKEFLYIDVMPGISTLRYNIDNAVGRIYVIKRYLTLPVMIKKYFPLSKKSSIFCEVGAAFNYDLNTQSEFYTDTSTAKVTQKNLGYTLSVNGSCGFKTQITRNVAFDINIYSQTDFVVYYKVNNNKIKTDRKLLSFNLYFKLKK